MMEPLTLLAGAGLLAAGWLAGHLTGRRAERRRLDKPREPICGCTHHLAAHDPKTSECTAAVERQLRNDRNSMAGTDWVECACRRYVGPEPISSVWVPPVAREKS